MSRVTVGYQDGCLAPFFVTTMSVTKAREMGIETIWVPDHFMGFVPKWMWKPEICAAANVIHSGDVMFNKVFPFIDLSGGGSVDGYIAGQQKILAMADDETKIIPGHGPLATKADLRAAVDMLIDAQARVKALVDAGKSKEEAVAAKPLAPYDSWNWDFITADIMTETIYTSLISE